MQLIRAALLLLAGFWATSAFAGVLPEDRADVLYHRYQGGGVTIQGPSVLVRKKFGEKFAATANYYMDFVSSASIDVKSTGSSCSLSSRSRSGSMLKCDASSCSVGVRPSD